MSDNKQLTGKADRNKVNSGEAYEVEYLHSQYPTFTHSEIEAAIRAAGPERKNIEAYLQKKAGHK